MLSLTFLGGIAAELNNLKISQMCCLFHRPTSGSLIIFGGDRDGERCERKNSDQGSKHRRNKM
jgi:hypothetical protein